MLDDILEELAKVRGHAPYRRFVKYVGVVVQITREASLRLYNLLHQIELRRTTLSIKGAQRKPAHLILLFLSPLSLQAKADLKQRCEALVPVRIQLLHDLFEREVLMRIRSE